jgi:hypothetical protein
LVELPRSLEVKRPAPSTRRLLDHVEERGGHRIEILKMTDDRRQPVSFRKRLWSPDGKVLYGLTSSNGLMRIDAEKWEVTAEYHPWTPTLGFRDIAWSSAGLVCVEASGNDDLSRETPWICLQPREPLIRNHPALRLMVLDPESFKTRHSWYVWGDRLAGHPNSSVIYIYRSPPLLLTARENLLVVDTVRGELLNAIDGNSLRPADDVVRKSDVVVRRFDRPGVSVDCILISPDGKWLLNVPDTRNDQSDAKSAVDISRFRINGPRLTCEQRILNLDKDERTPIKLTGDSRYVCTSEHSGPGYFFLDLTNFSRYVGSPESYSSGGPFAIDCDAKTIYFERTVQREVVENPRQGSITKWEFGIHIVQDGRTQSIPWPSDVGDLDVRPGHRGVFVVPRLTDQGTDCYWIEHATAGHAWSFEQKTDAAAPTSAGDEPKLQPETPANPLEPDPTRKGVLAIPIRAVWACWAPDGKAFVVVDLEGVIHRFEGATPRETRRLSFGKFRQTIATSAGLVIGDEKDKEFTLIDYESLAPVRKLDGLSRAAGNPLHSRIVGATEDGISVIDASTGKLVAQAKMDELAYQKLPGHPRLGSLAILNDGRRIVYNDCGQIVYSETKVALLHVKGTSLEVEFPPADSLHRRRMTSHLDQRIGTTLDVVEPADRHALDQYVRNLTPPTARQSGQPFIVFSRSGNEIRVEKGKMTVLDPKGGRIRDDRPHGLRVVPNPFDERKLLLYTDGPFTGLPSYLVQETIDLRPSRATTTRRRPTTRVP